MKAEDLNRGTYVGVRFHPDSRKSLIEYAQNAGIPNPLEEEDLHCTIVYSRKFLPEFDAYGEIDPPVKGVIRKLEIWPHKTDEGETKCLVIKFDCPALIRRHERIRNEHGATFDYDEYTPHITLSYDIGNLNLKDLPDIKQHIEEILIVEEYTEDLDINWTDS